MAVFNKAKAVEDAQKLVAAGKTKDAVAAFKAIHAREPKDQSVLNTLGEINERAKNIPQALEYYTKLADLYASDGFLVRSIAVYKKISKLDPVNTNALGRLADLYSMQGMLGDARAQYLQLVDAFLKANNAAKAMEVMQKLLDLDPDNLKIQTRLAELYERHGQPQQAAGVYRRLAQHALAEGKADEGQKWMDKAAALTPNDPEVLILKARMQQQAGQAADAIATLRGIPNLEENPEAQEVLLRAHLAAGNLPAAEELADKLFSADKARFAGLLEMAQHAAQQQDAARALGYLERVAEPALEHDPPHLLDVVRKVVAQLPDSAELLDLMARAARQSHDHSAQVEALSKQAGLAMKQEDYPRAKQLYDELVSLDPHSPEFTQRLNKVRELLGEPALAEAPMAQEAPAFEIPPPPQIELDEETQAFVNSTLTDIDLFSSYGMADKAIELAKELVVRVPYHIIGHEKLLDLYIGNSNDSGVVEIAGRLELLLRQAGNRPRADEVMSLARRYAEKAGIAVPGTARAAAPAPAAAPAAATFEIPAEAPAEPAFEIPAAPTTQEVDLSAEWATAAGGEAARVFNAEEAAQELDFYLGQGMIEEARQALARYETAFPGEPALVELAGRIEAASAPAAELPIGEEGVSEIELPAMAEEETVAEIPLDPEAAAVGADDGETYDIVLEEQPKEAAPAASAAGLSAADFFSDLAGELDQALETTKVPTAPRKGAAPPPPAAKAAPPPPVAAGPQPPVGVLAEVFEEFKTEMGATEEVEDVESHYNLGIAYKEMGLLDEAVSEFQKVAKAAEKQKTHSQLFQACTLQGVCFMDKGMPQIAVRWYERALKTPGVDEEGALALRYDMGLAHEQAGDRKAALECFMEVYGANVDYRDVGERIRELRGA